MFDVQMKIKFKRGNEVVAPVYPEHAILFEEKFDISFLDMFGDTAGTPRISWIYFIAFVALGNEGSFKKWVPTVDTIDIVHNGKSLFEEFAAAEAAGQTAS